MRVTILGGYGNAGIEIARLASLWTAHDIRIVGRREELALEAAKSLSTETGRAVEWGRCDAFSPADVEDAAAACDFLLVASSTTSLTGPVAKACLDAGTHYMDIGLSEDSKWKALRALQPEIEDTGLCFISDGGFHPGLPGMLIRYAGRNLAQVDTALVAGSFSLDWKRRAFSSSTTQEFTEELEHADLTCLRDGEWVTGYRLARAFDFGEPVGSRQCVPMMMEEVREAADQLESLRNAGFFVAGFGPVVDYGVMPLAMALGSAGRAAPGRLGRAMKSGAGRLFTWGLERFASAPEHATIQLEASSAAAGYGGKPEVLLRLRHPDPYVLTAAPVVSCLRQLGDPPCRTGLFNQASLLDPAETIADLRRAGAEIQTRAPAHT